MAKLTYRGKGATPMDTLLSPPVSEIAPAAVVEELVLAAPTPDAAYDAFGPLRDATRAERGAWYEALNAVFAALGDAREHLDRGGAMFAPLAKARLMVADLAGAPIPDAWRPRIEELRTQRAAWAAEMAALQGRYFDARCAFAAIKARHQIPDQHPEETPAERACRQMWTVVGEMGVLYRPEELTPDADRTALDAALAALDEPIKRGDLDATAAACRAAIAAAVELKWNRSETWEQG